MPGESGGKFLYRLWRMAAGYLRDKGFVTIDVLHHLVHIGKMFSASYKTPDGAPLANDAAIEMVIAVGSQQLHFTFVAMVTGESELAFYENPDVDDDGAVVDLRNMHRGYNDNDLHGTVATVGNTVNAVGGLLYNVVLPGGSTGQAQGSQLSSRENLEWLLQKNTTYLARVINRSGQTEQASLSMNLYDGDVPIEQS